MVYEIVLSRPSGDARVEFVDAEEGGKVGFVPVEVGESVTGCQGAVVLRLTFEDGYLQEAVGVYDGSDFSSFDERIPYLDATGLHLLSISLRGTRP